MSRTDRTMPAMLARASASSPRTKGSTLSSSASSSDSSSAGAVVRRRGWARVATITRTPSVRASGPRTCRAIACAWSGSASSSPSKRRFTDPARPTNSSKASVNRSEVTGSSGSAGAPSIADRTSRSWAASEWADCPWQLSAAWTVPVRGSVAGSSPGPRAARQPGSEVSARRPSSAVFPVPARPVTASIPCGWVSIQRTIRLRASRRPAKCRCRWLLSSRPNCSASIHGLRRVSTAGVYGRRSDRSWYGLSRKLLGRARISQQSGRCAGSSRPSSAARASTAWHRYGSGRYSACGSNGRDASSAVKSGRPSASSSQVTHRPAGTWASAPDVPMTANPFRRVSHARTTAGSRCSSTAWRTASVSAL
ncbi:hypothetical protein ABZ767_04830 [Streptomyces pseudogriseolus]|uniref:hypothetical protein n=1 Tax=Streptomyces pseudogriseolus TaxID=36817 RepID=UPI00349070B6